MKTILVNRNGFFTAFRMTALLLISANLFSQDYEPAQFRVRYKGNDTLLDITTMPEFQTKEKFVGGLHWGATKLYVKNNKFTNVHLLPQSEESDSITSSSALPDSSNFILGMI